MNDQTLELQIQSSSKEALNTLNKLVTLLTNVDKNISTINQKINTSNVGIKNTSKAIDTIKTSADKATTSTSKLGNVIKNAFTFSGVKRLTKTIVGFIDESVDYTEQLNLFNVVFNNIEKNGTKTFSTIGQEAVKFQNKLNEVFGTNKTETLYMQGIYQSMGETVGISDKYSAIMSETMTKLTYDLASLYNKSEGTVAEALRAGVYSGQTKPLRNYGIDVTYNSLQPVLDSLGIDEQVKNLSQAEKEILRYIATLKQASISMGDFANNLESPSNQMKIFKQQLVETKVALTSLFIGTFSNILPYANAFLMVVKEVANAIATMFGIELTDYNTGIASQEGIYDGIADSAEDATNAVKELKRQTLGFDEIHNINENKDSGSGTDVSGGIDQRLLDAITGYDNGMDKVKMKATEIRDKIMEWLGFTKELDPLTGKVSFKLKEGWSNLKLIGGIIATIIGFKIIKGIGNLITGTGKLSKILGTGGIYKSLKNLVTQTKTATTTNASLLKGITSGTSAWYAQIGALTKVGVGLAGLATSSYFAYDAGKELASGSENTASKLGQLVVSMGGATASGAILGSTFGPIGTVIGAAAGAVVSLTTAIIGYVKESNEIKVRETVFDEQGTSIDNLISKYQLLFDDSTKYSDTLDNLRQKYLDAKAGVESAEEEIDNFKASLDLQDEAITQSQIDELKTKYDNLKQSTIEANEASLDYSIALVKAYRDASSESEESTAIQIANIKSIMLQQQGYELDYIDRMKELDVQLRTNKISHNDYEDAVHQLNIEYGKTSDVTIDATKTIETFNDKVKDIDYKNHDTLKEKMQGIHEEYNKTIETLTDEKDKIKNHWQPLIEDSQKVVDNFEDMKIKGQELTEEEEERYETAKSAVTEYRKEMDTELESANATIEEIQGSYKGFISTVYSDLVSQGADTSDEFKETLQTIEEDLGTLKDVDMSDFGKELFDGMIESIIENEPSSIKTLNSKFKKYGIDAGDAFAEAVAEQPVTGRWRRDIEKNYGEIGKYTNRGTLQGTRKNIKEEGTSGKIISEESIKDTKNILEIHSPSAVYEKLGEYTVEGYIEGIQNKKNELIQVIKRMLESVKKEFNNVTFGVNISTSVESSFNSILSKLETFANKFRSGINNLLYGMTTSMNGVYVGSDNRIYYNSMPYVSVPRFANGGMPEDGLFFANHNELVGKFSNGNTAVANNEMIVEGIKAGVYEAVSMAVSQYGINQSSEIDVHVHTDEGTVIDRIEQRTKQTGVFPFTIPTY